MKIGDSVRLNTPMIYKFSKIGKIIEIKNKGSDCYIYADFDGDVDCYHPNELEVVKNN